MAISSSSEASIPRLALRVEQAAESLGVSTDYLREHILPNIKVVRNGRVKLIPVQQLEAWLDSAATQIDWK